MAPSSFSSIFVLVVILPEKTKITNKFSMGGSYTLPERLLSQG